MTEQASQARRILRSARSILLVDWPNPGVPRALIEAGLTVLGFSPRGYSQASLVADIATDVDAKDALPPRNPTEHGYLVFRRLGQPPAVEIVYVFRPIHELAGIVQNQVLPLGAKVLWLGTPTRNEEFQLAKQLAEENGLVLIAGEDIAQISQEY